MFVAMHLPPVSCPHCCALPANSPPPITPGMHPPMQSSFVLPLPLLQARMPRGARQHPLLKRLLVWAPRAAAAPH